MVYARVKRLLGRDSIVIVDGMNYIKGWRYQLWCESKEARTTSCVVWILFTHSGETSCDFILGAANLSVLNRSM